MKAKYAINLHKGLTFIVILTLMYLYHNFNIAPLIYLALHGSYGLMWLVKDKLYPDKQWELEISLSMFFSLIMGLGLYWIAPFLLISSKIDVPYPVITLAVVINLFGVFLHYSSDAQKYFTLKYRQGLITEGFFEKCRNTNYLGEFLIYTSFALLSYHWQAGLIVAFFVIGVFIPNMKKKDESLSRYPEFTAYQAQSGLIFPKF